MATVKPARTEIRVWMGLVCLYCLLGEQVIQASIDGLDIDIVWTPFELRPNPKPSG